MNTYTNLTISQSKYEPNYFVRNEFEDMGRMSTALLERLDDFREMVGRSFIITSSTDGKHAPGSQHYLGRAVDIVILNGEHIIDNYLLAERFGFSGIGVYPHWKRGRNRIGGLHLDVRDGASARWMGVRMQGKQVYVSLTKENLEKYT